MRFHLMAVAILPSLWDLPPVGGTTHRLASDHVAISRRGTLQSYRAEHDPSAGERSRTVLQVARATRQRCERA